MFSPHSPCSSLAHISTSSSPSLCRQCLFICTSFSSVSSHLISHFPLSLLVSRPSSPPFASSFLYFHSPSCDISPFHFRTSNPSNHCHLTNIPLSAHYPHPPFPFDRQLTTFLLRHLTLVSHFHLAPPSLNPLRYLFPPLYPLSHLHLSSPLSFFISLLQSALFSLLGPLGSALASSIDSLAGILTLRPTSLTLMTYSFQNMFAFRILGELCNSPPVWSNQSYKCSVAHTPDDTIVVGVQTFVPNFRDKCCTQR
ncbi:hypothetical protein C2E23DRAFT_49976 [Lenzites betulinus]|nr:hypothetical protein C2E23DRAFT_49976 [Lenzites betulinus]